jgi:hypothetical protein
VGEDGRIGLPAALVLLGADDAPVLAIAREHVAVVADLPLHRRHAGVGEEVRGVQRRPAGGAVAVDGDLMVGADVLRGVEATEERLRRRDEVGGAERRHADAVGIVDLHGVGQATAQQGPVARVERDGEARHDVGDERAVDEPAQRIRRCGHGKTI